MDKVILPQHAENIKPQIGPVYHCPACGAPARRLIPYAENAIGGSRLDEWGDHIAYLDLPAACRQAGHPARVAILGSVVVSLIFPYDTNGGRATTDECVALIRQALDTLARIVPPPAHDPAAAIVYRLLAGLLTPENAIGEIRALVRSTEDNHNVLP